MPTIELSTEEWQQVVNVIINANPLVVKIIKQLQEQSGEAGGDVPPEKRERGNGRDAIATEPGR